MPSEHHGAQPNGTTPRAFRRRRSNSILFDNNCSSNSGGVGHQQQTTESTNVIGNKSNNNATLQESSPPRYKSTQPSADSSRSTINQPNGGNNNNLQGNNYWQPRVLLLAAADNNNENTEQNRTQPLSSNNDVQFNTEERLVSTGRDPLQQIDKNNVGTVSSAVFTIFGRGLSNIASLLSQFPFGSSGSNSDIQRDDDNNDNRTKYQSPLKRTGPLVCPPTPNKDLLSLKARLQHRSKPHAKRIKSASESGRGGSDTALVCNISFLCIVVWHFIICLTYLMLYFSFVGGRNTRCGETR